MFEQGRNLTHKVAVVTGGGRGIGAAIARRLAASGAAVLVAGRTNSVLAKTAAEIQSGGGTCEPFVCDVADLAAVERLADAVRRKHGGCDILVNNAGVGSFSVPLFQLSPEEWD